MSKNKFVVFRGDFFLATPDEVERADWKGHGQKYAVTGGVVKEWIRKRIIGFKCHECGRGTMRDVTPNNYHWKSVVIPRAVVVKCDKRNGYSASAEEIKRLGRIVSLRESQEEQSHGIRKSGNV